MNVVNKIIKTELRNWKELIPFQPDNFKKTDPRKLKKLVESYKKNGKLNPFAVWENKGKVYIIDGHATQEVFSIMESEGISIPDKFPCIFLDLKDKREAKKAVLVYNSHYRDVDSSSAFEFIKDLDMQEILKEIEIPEISDIIAGTEEINFDSYQNDKQNELQTKLGEIKDQRLKMNAVHEGDDSEFWIAVLFRDRSEKENFLKRFLLDADTRYINGDKFDEIFTISDNS